ncbi:MAG TPA: PQQ-binding-like beta-propeller repeat protein [Gaiellaceae bacterium]|nr:PQQ-binding-like beta-propeller repeat protein [Gaiellaceae bacterium]
MRRKWVLAAAGAVVLLLAGAAAAYYFYERNASRDIRGSSTVEFVPTEAPPTVPKPPPKPRKRTGPRKPAALTRVDWPTYGFDDRRLRSLPSKLRPPFRVQWTFRGRHLLEFPPVVAYGRAYVANNPGILFAVQTATGRTSWRYTSGRCTAASPAVAGEVVYMAFMNLRRRGPDPCNAAPGTPGLDGLVVALDARKGTVRWQRKIGPSETSPLVANGLVYVGDWNGYVYALEARTGREVWRYKTDGAVKGAAALSGRRLYVGSYDHHLYALTARTGRLLWRGSSQDRLGGRGTFYSTPAAAYGRVYIGSTDGKVYSFGATTGEVRWSQSTGGYVYGSPAIWNKHVFVGSYSGRFYSLDAATGDVAWQFEANGPISGSATVLGDLVYFSTLKERTYALDAATGKQVWSFPDGKYSPLVAGPERVYLTGYTRLYGMVTR